MSEERTRTAIDDAAPESAFEELDQETWRWRKAGDAIHLWWRDDDASSHNVELERLTHALSGVPMTLAVVPGLLEENLVRFLARTPNANVVQHGWMHKDHSLDGAAPSEYPPSRDWSLVTDELRRGQAVLKSSFAERYHPAFVPPWHRCAPHFLRALPDIGFRGVSLAAPLMPWLRYGYCGEVNVEIDLCDWPRRGDFIGAAEFARRLTRSLGLRRQWRETDQPIGILSHHAMMGDEDCLGVARVLRQIGDAARWRAINELESAPLPS